MTGPLFWLNFPSVTVIGVGKRDSRPIKAESKQHGYWAFDTGEFFLAGNDLSWLTVGGSSGNAEFPRHITADLTIADNTQKVVSTFIVTDATLTIAGLITVFSGVVTLEGTAEIALTGDGQFVF